MRHVGIPLLCTVGLLSFAGSTRAGEVSLPVTEVALIESPGASDFRILLKFAGIGDLDANRVDVANLVMPDFEFSGTLPLDAYPINTAWSEGAVSWGETWSSIGGEGEHRCGRILLSDSDGVVRAMRVTRYARAAASGGSAANGLLLRRSSYSEEAGAEGIPGLVAQLRSARIVVLLAE